MYVKINDNVLTDLVLQDAATGVGPGVAMPTAGRAGLVLQVSGTFVATVVFEATQDEVNWVAILGQNLNSGGQVTSTTTPGLFAFAVNGLKYVRARISSYTSGAVTVKGSMSPMPLAGLSSAVKIKDATGTNTWNIGADGSAPVQLTGRKASILVVDASSTTTVNAGAGETITVTPPAGKMYKLRAVGIAVNAPAGGTTGYHSLAFYISAAPVNINLLYLNTAYNKSMSISYSKGADTTIDPSTFTDFLIKLTNVVFDNDTPLKVYYYNGTDAAQTNPRRVFLLVEEEAII